MEVHGSKPTRQQLTNNTTIIARDSNRFRLAIKEALLIMSSSPSMNIQFENFSNILKLHNSRNPQQKNLHPNPDLSSLSPSGPNTQPSILLSTQVPSCNNNQHNITPTSPLLLSPINHLRKDPQKADALNIPHSIFHSTPKSTNPKRHNTEYDTRQLPLIDLNIVLLKFGINYELLKPVPLENYHWWAFHGTDPNFPLSSPPSLPTAFSSIELMDSVSPVKLPPIMDSTLKHPSKLRIDDNVLFSTVGNISPTISQRIHSMVRRARTKNTAPQT